MSAKHKEERKAPEALSYEQRCRDNVRTYRHERFSGVPKHVCLGCMRERRNAWKKSPFCDSFCEELYRLHVKRQEEARLPWEEKRRNFFGDGAIPLEGASAVPIMKIGPLESAQYEPPYFR